MAPYKQRVLELVNTWDPANLMSHAPDDEYEHEVDEIINIARAETEANHLGEAIEQVFLMAFGEDRFKKTRAECIRLAQELLDTRPNHQQ